MQLTVQGMTICYEQYGHSGVPILLLHGWGCDSSIFQVIVTKLRESFGLVLLDFPGHGHTDRPPNAWGVQEYAQVTHQLMQELHITSYHIIAHSFGGRVALWLASHYPDEICKLVITGGAGIKKEASLKDRIRQICYFSIKSILQMMKRVDAFKNLSDNLIENLRFKYSSRDYKVLDHEMRQTFVKVISQDLRFILPLIQSPTLLVWGENDTETPIWMGKTMAAAIPDSALICFNNAGHYAFIEQWQRFCIIIHRFFSGE